MHRSAHYQYDRDRADLVLKIEAFVLSSTLIIATVIGVYGMI